MNVTLKSLVVPTLVAVMLMHTPAGLTQEGTLRHGLTPFYGTPLSPSLDLRGLDGKRYRMSDYAGKVVIVNFWATWCPPCIAEMPTLQTIWERFRHTSFEVLAVNIGDSEKVVRRFLDRFEPKLEFPILLADDEEILDVWRIQGLPMSYIVDVEGRWAYGELGPRDFSHEHILKRIRDLLSKGS